MPLSDHLVIENANIMFRNFAGLEKPPYNALGDRNFLIFLEPDMAAKMRRDGWNVKSMKPREEDDNPQEYVQVAVNYQKGRPPRVVLISSAGRTELGSDEVGIIDIIDIKNADVTLNPYNWDVNGNQGVKAYLRSAFITIDEDELDLKYAHVPSANPTQSSSSTANEEEMV